MSDPTTAMPIDEITRLRARVRELEAQLNKAVDTKSDEDRTQTPTRRVANSMSNVSRSKRDATNRMVHSATLAKAEFVRAFADTAFRLPKDIATSVADAIDRFVEVPAKVADRYASAYRSGEKTDSSR